jgi:hypothetical protein
MHFSMFLNSNNHVYKKKLKFVVCLIVKKSIAKKRFDFTHLVVNCLRHIRRIQMELPLDFKKNTEKHCFYVTFTFIGIKYINMTLF